MIGNEIQRNDVADDGVEVDALLKLKTSRNKVFLHGFDKRAIELT